MIKNENQYLHEHIVSDMEAGIDHFYIYDDRSDIPVEKYLKDNYPELLEFCTITVVDESKLDQTILEKKGRQVAVYNNWLNTYSEDTVWVSVTDTDEIWEGDLKSFLKKNENEIAVFVPWIIHGANGHLYRDYTSLRDAFKSNIISYNDFDDEDPYISMNNCFYYRGKSIYNCDQFLKNGKYIIDIHNITRKDNIEGPRNNSLYVNIDYWTDVTKSYYEGNQTLDISLHHYFFKSLEDFLMKINRSYAHVSTPANSLYSKNSDLSTWVSNWVGLDRFFDMNHISPFDPEVKALLEKYNIEYVSKYRNPEDYTLSVTELMSNPKSDKAKHLSRILKTIKEQRNKVINLPKILITGISGFIGRSLVKALVDQRYSFDIYGVDINPLEMDEAYKNKVKFTQLDLREADQVKSYFSSNKFNGVIHLAAVSRAENDRDNCIKSNLQATKNIVNQLSYTPNTWIMFFSSMEVYGESENSPVKESDEKHPINIYGECKLKSEEYIQEHMSKYLIFRFSNVYGNEFDLENRVLPLFVNKSLNNETVIIEGGEQIIDFTYINDVVLSMISAIRYLNSGTIKQDIIHLSSGEGHSLQTVIEILEKYLEKEIKVEVANKRDYDVVRFVGDPEHRKKIFGNKQFISLEDGLIRYAAKMIRIKKNKEA